jgi:hypothetical protein
MWTAGQSAPGLWTRIARLSAWCASITRRCAAVTVGGSAAVLSEAPRHSPAPKGDPAPTARALR